MKLKTNCVFGHLEDSTKRITVEQGGTRSGKTYNILIWFIIRKLTQETNKVLSIFRLTRPAVKATVLRDFKEIMLDLGLWNDKNFNKTDLEYRFNGNLIEFCGLDDDQKIRGRKRNYLFCNEFNEIVYDKWMQLLFRTSEKIIIDFNPSDDQHFVFTDVITRDDCDFYQTTYLDNPFLEDMLVDEIERLKGKDDYFWQVYGLGEKGKKTGLIFPNYKLIEPDLFGLQSGAKNRGMDFGFNDPTALTTIKNYDRKLFLREDIYKSYMKPSTMISEMNRVVTNKRTEIMGDCARPDLIEQIFSDGFNIHPCVKGKDSVVNGIIALKDFEIFVTKDSINLIKELNNYKWKQDKNGKILDEPVDAFNHCFSGDTLITTKEGQKEIKDITTKDYVLTSKGYKRVLKRWDNGEKEIRSFTINNKFLSCTPDHKIFTLNKGFISIERLTLGDIVCNIDICKNGLRDKYIIKKNITCMKMKDISLKGLRDCIGWFGRINLGIYRKVLMFIILMGILIITRLKTLSWLKKASIYLSILKNGIEKIEKKLKNIYQKLDLLQKNGIQAKKLRNGGNHNTKTLWGNLKKIFRQDASNAELYILLENQNIKRQDSALINANHKTGEIAELIMRKDFALNAKQFLAAINIQEENIVLEFVRSTGWGIVKKEKTYDLTVEEQPEYFANGLLVHNCIDGVRYGIKSSTRDLIVL